MTMGLTATAKGLTQETCFDCGYATFGAFRMALAKAAYGPELGAIYRTVYYEGREPTTEEAEKWTTLSNPDLNVFLFHDDGDGKFTPKECRRIYETIKDLQMDMIGHNYIVMKPYNMLEHWKAIFLHCARRRVNLWFH